MAMFGKKNPSTHHVKVQVLEPPDDILQRTAILHTALMKAIAGTRLQRHIKSDLQNGCIEVVVVGDTVCPPINSGAVRVDVKPVRE